MMRVEPSSGFPPFLKRRFPLKEEFSMRYTILAFVLIGILTVACSQSNAQQNANSRTTPTQERIGGTPYGDYIIGDPVSYTNLSLFPILSKAPKNQDRYITLDEGLASGSVKVAEVGAQNGATGNAAVQAPPQRQVANQRRSGNTRANDDLFGSGEVDGDVNKLMVENKSGKPLFLMPGGVISGGK
jgi:hypothetical protein